MSLFAQTVLEQEQAFYRQFPEAKKAHLEQWSYPPAQQGIYSEGQPGCEYYGEGNTLLTVSNYPEPVNSPLALNPPIYTAPPPYSPHLVQHHGSGLVQEHSLRHLSSQTTFKNTTPLSIFSAPSKLTSLLVPTITLNHNTIQLTGDWETDAHAANECLLRASALHHANVIGGSVTQPQNLDGPQKPQVLQQSGGQQSSRLGVSAIAVANQPVINAPLNTRRRVTPRLQKPVRAQSHSYAKKNLSSNSLSSRSGLAPVKVVKAKMDGLKMACHYCKRRKIGCGAPPKESVDRTCE